MRVSIIQMNSTDDVDRNLATVERLVSACVASDRPELIALPEYFSCLVASPDEMRAGARRLAERDVPRFLADLARRHRICVHGGSSLVLEGDRLYNESTIVSADGALLGTYRKIHLFDTTLPDGTRLFESDTICRGERTALFDCGDIRFGCSICFDLRFPELYARLAAQGAQCLLVPSAFTFPTGADHWEILLRARAIETQCYVMAPAQVFAFGGGKYACWGHAMIVDPWGAVVAQVSAQEGFASADLAPQLIAAVRRRLPVSDNRFWSAPNGH